LSFLSVELHTEQSQPIIGTPPLVPVPKNVIVNGVAIILQTYTICECATEKAEKKIWNTGPPELVTKVKRQKG
jgi:hypothetical protein